MQVYTVICGQIECLMRVDENNIKHSIYGLLNIGNNDISAWDSGADDVQESQPAVSH